ncbi:MAG: hypothetical protein JNM71_01590 [Flavobacterium lindanitolerans]|uniref:hypothetical protein n=1 Tax=Flavobacterium lindanitolerans TaxID=428988 RepID=UPI001A47E7CC|nr:hypothetical protein [Flavobacterium lindanitolerans]MBL7866691.1 hypothetical protein [Flavobacterium lindanitolerans]
MKHILDYFSLLLLFVSLGCDDSKQEKPSEDRKVYVCESAMSFRYHLNPECPGLKQCIHDVSEISESSAKRQGRMFCGRETDYSAYE